jgi:hypothetical protein
MNENVNDFLSNLDENIFELYDVQSSALKDTNCIILYGNDELYLHSYAKAMIQDYFKKPLVITEHTGGDTVYKKSQYHFELDYSQAQNVFIKNIIKNKNITGNRFIFILNKVTISNKQQQLLKLIDGYSNSTFIILSKSIAHLDYSIKSRSMMVRLPFTYKKIKEFVQRHYKLDITQEQAKQHSIISLIAEITVPKYEKELEKLLQIIAKGRNQLDITMAIKEYCYKVFHMCIQLSQLCKLVIKNYNTHVKIRDIVHVCAEADCNMMTGTRDILCYEQLFIKIWEILRL